MRLRHLVFLKNLHEEKGLNCLNPAIQIGKLFLYQGIRPESFNTQQMSPSEQANTTMCPTDSVTISERQAAIQTTRMIRPNQRERTNMACRRTGPTDSYENPIYRYGAGANMMDISAKNGTIHAPVPGGPPPIYSENGRISALQAPHEKLDNEPPPPYTPKEGNFTQNGLICLSEENKSSQNMDHKHSYLDYQGKTITQVNSKNTHQNDVESDQMGEECTEECDTLKDSDREDSGGSLFHFQPEYAGDNLKSHGDEEIEACRLVSIDFNSVNDLTILQETDQQLKECHFYYPRMTSRGAKKILNKRENGTFLIRDSTDSHYLYSLSVKTPRGTTSVRLLYERGMFSIDCDAQIKNEMPKFTSVLKLVHYYMKLSVTSKPGKCVWLEQSGRKSEPVKILFPLVHGLPTLSHSCRKTINEHVPDKHIQDLPLPEQVKKYIKENPITGKSHRK
ncbi:unnamed protein product [Owenia fusiformis]|uniref:Uncharacterized protein n=1 Tax=Owenia fusiformis TaxID=6347 RepID=A0A8S4PIG6_OWEFU|nr:unnamed protein product [Owenia fusiformis]